MVLTPDDEGKNNSYYWICMQVRNKSQSSPEALWASALQAVPACAPEVTYQGLLGGGYPGASSISSNTLANTCLLHSERSQAGLK